MFKVIYEKNGIVAGEKYCGKCNFLKWSNKKHNYFCKHSKRYLKTKNEGLGATILRSKECLEKYKGE